MEDIYVGDAGKGFPLVLVHGFLGSSQMWKPQIEFFKKDCNKSISEGYLFKYKLFFNAITDSLNKKNICEQMKTDYEEKMEEVKYNKKYVRI